ncbi:uncharacterized protein L969DRAFT_84723 [Mixia osmundae IAM 14324]|uniref:Sodium/calcium exchanger membrane region domain-containing protein n=1 Tax=Mixia osmundae (strain CBS 9802 / IAM 14324 / JCM 22182 / KY 12970) TaxID=764103 RepID=G7DTI4_MIXOS|nr:uncharacterized protein L969DRAFT_84723 [Mixia osmundae IAM 14324]KEI42832.1 hypothetical protein L969DRAFT_84723 [Mixia osmundae IAM 14324]GAA93831.1 hypothetical protein E5Q_00477 [Mixia osmundae IAM 14324]
MADNEGDPFDRDFAPARDVPDESSITAHRPQQSGNGSPARASQASGSQYDAGLSSTPRPSSALMNFGSNARNNPRSTAGEQPSPRLDHIPLTSASTLNSPAQMQTFLPVDQPNASIDASPRSRDFNQTFLGRGRAPSGAGAAQRSTSARPSILLNPSQAGRSPNLANVSLTAPSSATIAPNHARSASWARSTMSDAGASILSDDISSPARTAQFANAYDQPRSDSRTRSGTTGQIPSGRAKGKAAVAGPPAAPPLSRQASQAPKGRARAKSRSRRRGSDSGSDDEQLEPTPDRSHNVSVGALGMVSNTGELEGDDEVHRRDRGEELVRKRMRERKKERKEAEKREKKRQDEEQKQVQKAANARPRAISRGMSEPGPSSQWRSESMPPGRPKSTFNQQESLSTASQGTMEDDRDNVSPLSATFRGRWRDIQALSAEASSSRDASVASWQGKLTADDADPETRPASSVTFNEAEAAARDRSVTPTRLAHGARSSIGQESASRQAEARPMSRHETTSAAVPAAGSQASSRRPSDAHSYAGTTERSASDKPLQSDDEDMEAEPEPLEDDDIDEDDDEDIDDADVEYTLKDRQDAINIEHPFGLPIWKPALYKKSRSVHRNAETALHEAPSLQAERHLLVGNILWTILFGFVLFLVCAIVGSVLFIVPWGGAKYARVVWELASYLFWPFGRYVEGHDEDQSGETDEGSLDRSATASPSKPQSTDTSVVGTRRDSDGTLQGLPSNAPATAEDSLIRRSGSSVVAARKLAFAEPSDERSPLVRRCATDPELSSHSLLEDDPKGSLPSTSSSHYGTFSPSSGKPRPRQKPTIRVRALGRLTYWVAFWLVIAPVMLVICVLCWGLVFTIPMAKLLWVLLCHLAKEPLSLHFRSPKPFDPEAVTEGDGTLKSYRRKFRPGQPAPIHSHKTYAASKAAGRLDGPGSTILLCTYRAIGLQYYKYTVDGVNIMFINLLPFIIFVILDDFFLEPYVHRHQIGGLIGFVAAQPTIFVLALLSVIPLSYFIGMAVASISAQSSIGMGAVINATFGSIIEVILYGIALTRGKSVLVEGSIVGSLLAGVLLMPGVSMIGGAFRRKEQRFNARSAGVTSTMLIMAIIGALTPTMFYEVYGTFELTCTGCPTDRQDSESWQCKRCSYAHIDPVDDPFYQGTVKLLSYYCSVILLLSYLIGLWFSLRTHASQIWQNAHALPPAVLPARPDHIHDSQRSHATAVSSGAATGADVSTVLSPGNGHADANHYNKKKADPSSIEALLTDPVSSYLPDSLKAPELRESVQELMQRVGERVRQLPPIHEATRLAAAHDAAAEEPAGHDAPNWSRVKSYSVLLACTILYALIAEVLVGVVDVVLEGSGIPEKLLGVTLFALVPNTTEFMNAISFAINGNIALSMEIGSAYAIQVCLLQIPAMVAFTALYSSRRSTMIGHAFTLVFPRWDVIAIMFSVFLLTYVYIEARSNYYRGSVLVLSYLVLMGGFAFGPAGADTEVNPLMLMKNLL